MIMLNGKQKNENDDGKKGGDDNCYCKLKAISKAINVLIYCDNSCFWFSVFAFIVFSCAYKAYTTVYNATFVL